VLPDSLQPPSTNGVFGDPPLFTDEGDATADFLSGMNLPSNRLQVT
jgi:hypothetical protein